MCNTVMWKITAKCDVILQSIGSIAGQNHVDKSANAQNKWTKQRMPKTNLGKFNGTSIQPNQNKNTLGKYAYVLHLYEY